MLRSETRILTTHAGSLPRPRELIQLYAERARGAPIDPATIEQAGRAALRWVVPKQLESGIDIGNNGEQQREAFFLYVQRRMSGFGGSWNRRSFADMTRYPAYAAMTLAQAEATEHVSLRGALPKAIGEVRYLDRRLVEAECADFGDVLTEVDAGFAQPFMTAPSPGIIAAAMLNAYYDTEDAYLAALGEALRVEYETIVRHNYVLQIDAPDLAMERHITYQDRPLADFLGFAERVIATINAALANVPREQVRLHVCWGNYQGPHDCDVPLRDILPVLKQARVGALVLPFANPRHAHEYRVLDELQEGQLVVAGVIDTVTNYIEHPEVVADRLEQIARVLDDPCRLIAGTDCGFDTSAGRGLVAEDVVWAKLRALNEGARIASARLGMNRS
ncbi:cobalamin-independent methionine synthase II family protein [Bradyrhizobium sp. LHD-71]|uniref:cobalamin-independent methionine synthase II family protein n=1 Tax=Bradyrhizobium sp. LHD-71 TaxID=3072141 RepID=UPI00280D0C63|nr:cobalamin-independent methionine synthase II family protein [Bradyrhizobium sp. LHD-71]MDQ8732337.1 cobalamin-independent methionine synthase II family protein [Bradyrhizobium sp. LHD-71]